MSEKQMKPLQVSGLIKRYGDLTAVDNLNLEVSEGEIFGLLGPNGAGKSTTIECILGTRDADGGEVRILGQSPGDDRKQLFEEVGVQFQNSRYHELIKVRELYRMMAVLYSNPVPMQELLAGFGLATMADKRVADLSGGQRQKLSVVLALVNRPRIVFLDELTTGLDPGARRLVWSVLRELKESGTTVFLTSHYMDEVQALCDRILIMDRGREVITGTPAEVIRRSKQKTLEDAYLQYTGKEADNETYVCAV